MILGAVVSFVVALLVSGSDIYISGRLVAGVDDNSHAVVTALLGAAVWATGSLIPLIGPVVALVAWVWVVKWRYPGGWKDAAIMRLVARAAALVVIAVLDGLLGLDISAFGVPGVRAGRVPCLSLSSAQVTSVRAVR